jgi:hypothetical protein
MSQSLSVERQQEVGLSGQERLHDDIINDGLGKLYLEFLNEAEHRFNANDLTIEKDLVTGKAYHALACRAKECDADLIVVSRYGNHHESSSRLGSNAESLIRTTSANVLLVGGVDDKGDAAETTGHAEEVFARESALVWDSQAQLRLQRVPSFVRSMAKRAVENAVRQLGRHRVSLEDFDSVAARFGMGTRGGDE